MMTGSDMECDTIDNISAKTLTASNDSASDKGDASLVGVPADYTPSIFIRIFVAEFNIQKCLQFPPTTAIWEVKQRLFATLPKELKDSANYGLFYPPYNGRAGKFLDDERELKDYPMPGHVGYLELKYKRRVYKIMNLDEKVLKQLHTKSNLRKFIDAVLGNHCDKINKLCNKGLDPNFHDLDNGETPLTLATTLKEPVPVLVALINGGAHLDFRALDGCTPVHRAAQHSNLKALQGLLELGSSANYKDSKGLTPLYYAVSQSSNPSLCELLLHDYALPGAVDPHGSQESHQACRNGYVRHLEHLIFYGADIDARNASGNTPLHVCAVNNQESCARVLLFRGADKHAKNYANQTAYHIAVIAGATMLADVIKTHSSKDVVPLREKPTYNPRRRRRSQSPSSSTMSRTGSVSRLSSRSPSLSHGGGHGGGGTVLASPSVSSRSSYALFSATGSVSSQGSSNCENHSQPSDDQCSSSGVVTDKSSCSDDSTCTPSLVHLPPNSRMSRLSQQHRIEPIRTDRMSIYSTGGRSEAGSVKSAPVRRADSAFFTDSAPPSRDVSVERHRVGVPRCVTLMRGPQGFGFVLRGSKHGNMTGTRDLQTADGESPPALQYLDEVDRGGPADVAGLRPGDYLLSIGGEDVRAYPHEQAVQLIRVAQHSVTLTVLTCPTIPLRCSGYAGSLSKPPLKVPPPPRRDPRTSLTMGPERSRSYLGLNDLGSTGYDTVSGEAKIASIRTRPASRRITAVEIEELIERTNQGPNPSSPSSLSSFTPLPKSDTPNGTASRVFSSVAHMKRQRAALQHNRRKTDTVNASDLHKSYHSTPDLSAEAEDLRALDDEEELYSDTVSRPIVSVPVDTHQYNGHGVAPMRTSANEPPHGSTVRPSSDYHELRRESLNHRSVPTTHQQVNSRPSFATAQKPPLPPNRPPATQVINKPPEPAGTYYANNTMKPSYSLDERTYSHLTVAAHVHEPPAYAVPDDPEPDYFSDEDRVSHTSSGRGASVASSVPSTPAVTKAQPTGPRSVPNGTLVSRAAPPQQRMQGQPPPPPPPPVMAGGPTGSSFADAIAKAAQARRENVESKSHLPHTASAPVLISNTLKPISALAAAAPKQDDFQSELMRAIQRRSQEKEPVDSNRNSSSSDQSSSTNAAEKPSENLSSVKDRIVFLERQRAQPGALKGVRLTGFTADQSSTDCDDSGRGGGPIDGIGSIAARNAGGVSVRAGIQKGTARYGGGEIDEGMAGRFTVQPYRSVSGGAGYLRDHDSASINSQSSASTLSSGYESPTLKYGSAGEHLWSNSIPQAETLPSRKFTPGYSPVSVGIAPPPEFS